MLPCDYEVWSVTSSSNSLISLSRTKWATSWENQPIARKSDFEIFQCKYSLLAILEPPEKQKQKVFRNGQDMAVRSHTINRLRVYKTAELRPSFSQKLSHPPLGRFSHEATQMMITIKPACVPVDSEIIMMWECACLLNTVKPVQNDHPWCKQKRSL